MVKPPLIVDVWTWALDVDPARQARLAEWLAPEEHARVASFAIERLRGRWIVARAGMRSVLARYASSSPEALRFLYGAHGKPTLRDGPDALWFNLSHSDDRAVLAVGAAQVGADVERIGAAHEDVAQSFFSAAEAAAFMAEHEPDRAEAFYRFWTAKEAFLKALGTGFSRPSDSFTIACAKDAPPRLIDVAWLDEPLENWRFERFTPAPGFMGAVAVRALAREVKITLHCWDD